MTPDERAMLAEALRLARETNERVGTITVKVDAVDDFLMQPTGPGRPSRAQALDNILDVVGATKTGGRVVLWVAGAIAALAAAWTAVKGWSLPR